VGIVVLCSVLLVIGLVLTALWGSFELRTPELPEQPHVTLRIRRYIWSVSLLLWTAIATALLVAGPAARLAMRVLAVTAGSRAQGHLTEAEEVVGRISGEGTTSIFLFVGLLAGIVSAMVFMVLRRWLPTKRAGGLALGLFLLVVIATRFEPLRTSNEDFDLVGPGWLSITIYSTMALVQGLAVVAFSGRMSRWLPMPGRRITSMLPHAVVLLLIPAAIGGFAVVLAGVVVVAAGRTDLPKIMSSPRVLTVGRAVLVLGMLVALPGFVSSIVDIAGRGPG
jgi:hypothetical protein